jgi:hypothetical protein
VGEFFQQKRHGYGKLFITHCDHGILWKTGFRLDSTQTFPVATVCW